MKGFQQFFAYYDYQCRQLPIGSGREVKNTAARNHEDLLAIIKLIRKDLPQKTSICRKDLIPAVRALPQYQSLPAEDNDLKIINSINLALRLWLTMQVGDSDKRYGSGDYIQWEDEKPLKEFIADQFPPGDSGTVGADHKGRMDVGFCASNLRKLYNVKTERTLNLKNHLKYEREDGVLYIYPLTLCLKAHHTK